MFHLLLSRLLQLPIILLVVFILTFFLAWIVPGDPLSRTEGRRPPAEIQQAMRQQYQLDKPLYFASQYLYNAITRFDLGPSLQYRDQRVSDIIASGLPVSAALGTVAILLALLIGLGTGILGALYPKSPYDSASLILVLLGISLPSFVTGSILLVVFAGILHWFPVAGWGTFSHLFLPALTLSLAPAAYIARLIRLGLADTLNADYIRTARAKGLAPLQIITRHALKVAFLPVLSFLGPAAAYTLTGSFVIEKIFAIPGIGEHFVNAVLNKDQFLTLGLVLTYASILILANLAVDLAYAWIDPRISY